MGQPYSAYWLIKKKEEEKRIKYKGKFKKNMELVALSLKVSKMTEKNLQRGVLTFQKYEAVSTKVSKTRDDPRLKVFNAVLSFAIAVRQFHVRNL
jgi:hypothetical protein